MREENAIMGIQCNTAITEKTELKNAKLLYILMAALLIVDWVLPQYFGFHVGFDFTGTRLLNMVIIVYFLLNRKAGNHFIRTMLDVQVTPYLALYMFVMIYTTILRVNVNTFFLNFLDILTFYMVYYGIRYVLGIKKAIDWTVKIAWLFSIYGLIEYVLGYSPMIKFLMTLPNNAKIVYRSGQYRIMGPCVHSIAYGMMILLMTAIVCIDYDNDEVYLFNHPFLYFMLVINMFLTGSRGSLALMVVETFLIIIFSRGTRKKKTFLFIVFAIIAFVIFEAAIFNTSLGRYVMMQITSVIDEVLGTSISGYFGADTLLLSQSSSYRDLLPRIFTVDWLNPLLGYGANAAIGFEFDGVYIRSIDNFYVQLYIRYAYPGLITYVLFMVMSVLIMFKTGFQNKSGLCISLGIGVLVYCISLFFVDYLQTTKYMYILIAIYAAYHSDYTQRKGLINE